MNPRHVDSIIKISYPLPDHVVGTWANTLRRKDIDYGDAYKLIPRITSATVRQICAGPKAEQALDPRAIWRRLICHVVEHDRDGWRAS